jgi:hypothetical protein
VPGSVSGSLPLTTSVVEWPLVFRSCNDITLAEDAFSRWVEEERPAWKGRQTGAKMYFFRLQISHIHEAMEVIKQIKKDHLLAVEATDPRTRESFAALQAFLKSDDYKKIAKLMRHFVTFHYQQGPVETSPTYGVPCPLIFVNNVEYYVFVAVHFS